MRRHPHPILYMFLILPFGVMGGYVSVAIAYLLSKQGVPVEKTAALVALGLLPHTWKFLWAPIADTTLSRRLWYLVSCIVSAAGVIATGVFPATEANLTILSVVVLVSNFASTFLGMSVEGLMAYGTTENEKGRAGGWFQAGNLGGAGVGGGAGLLMAQHLPAEWMAGAILGLACLLCAAGLLFVQEPEQVHRRRGIVRDITGVGLDLWRMARTRMGFLALFLCILPIGSGAASGLWSAVAEDWQASANTVAVVTGVLGGVVSAAGCLIGGWICDRMDRKAAYIGFGILQALCAVAMAIAPRTEAMYIVFTSLYALITGFTFAGFTAFVLEAMGLGAAATKYNVFASLSNTPIYYMTMVDGWAHTRFGPAGMLHTEAALGGVGLLAFIAVLALVQRRRPVAVP